MKKLFLLIALMATLLPGFAQTEENVPNRILVTNTSGNYTGFKIDYLDQVSFARVDGDVLANVTVNAVYLDSLKVSVTRTPECMYYKLAVIPQVTASQLRNDVTAIRYINSLPSSMVAVLYDDYSDGLLTGIQLNAESDYSLYTVGIDRYGVEAGVAKAEFSTPAPEIVGNPHVDMEIVETSHYSFTLSFTPNEDVYAYWTVAAEKGTMQQQYEMFGPMFGFSNFSDMIRMWGIERYEACVNTWNQMAPNTEYEVFVAMEDVNGNMAPYEVYEVSTDPLGGPGEASVAISVVDYALSDWYGEEAPTLTVNYLPNDQTSCYRVMVVSAETYADDHDAVIAELCSEPWMPTSNWFIYGEATYDYKVPLSTEVVILAAGKNIDGVWGAVSEVYYTTADSLEGYEPSEAPAKAQLRSRVSGAASAAARTASEGSFAKGILPNLKAPAKLELHTR